MAEFGFLNLGYNKEGYNKKGFDRQGYDREGYNKLGFNKDGYNKEGFDREGYNLEGYNKQGYNRLGYDKNGFNVKGINALGINVWGYDSSWHDKNGFDPLGYDKNGNDRYGFKRKGFNIDGNNTIREVSSGSDIKIDEFDKNGYSPDGLPKQGFNDFIIKYSSALDKQRKQFYSTFKERKQFNETRQNVEKFKDLCKNGNVGNRKEKGYSSEDVRKLLIKNRNALKEIEALSSLKLLIEYFIQNNCFLGNEAPVSLEKYATLEEVADVCKKRFPFLFVIVPSIETIEDRLARTYNNKTQAIEIILNQLYVYKKITKKSEVVNLFEGLRTTSLKNASSYLALIDKVLNQNEDISLKIAILEDLQKNSWLFASHVNDEKYEVPDEKRFLNEILCVYKALGFNESTKTIGEQFRFYESVDSVFDFFKAFDMLCDTQGHTI